MSFSRREVLGQLEDWAPQGVAADEMRGYLVESAGRLGATAAELMGLPRGSRVLEIGGDPYFLTALMRQHRPDLDWTCTNWFEGSGLDGGTKVLVNARTGERAEVRWTAHNIERSALPFGAEAFDCIAFCEVLEHLYEDPAASLEHLHRALKPRGRLVLSTPNPARFDNILRLLARRSISDPISGYGPYGRHNREYSAAELAELLHQVGFDVERQRTIQSASTGRVATVLARLGYGEYHLVGARRRPGPARRYRPAWLYRSFHGRD